MWAPHVASKMEPWAGGPASASNPAAMIRSHLNSCPFDPAPYRYPLVPSPQTLPEALIGNPTKIARAGHVLLASCGESARGAHTLPGCLVAFLPCMES